MLVLLTAACAPFRTNADDNADPERRAEMLAFTLEQGRLAPFPPRAESSFIRTEGGPFSRTFVSGFCAAPDVTDAWVAASPGLIVMPKDPVDAFGQPVLPAPPPRAPAPLVAHEATYFTSKDGWMVFVTRDERCVKIQLVWS